MHKEIELLHDKNVLMIKLMWAFFAFANLTHLLVEGSFSVRYVFIGMIIFSVPMLLVYLKWQPYITMMIIVFSHFLFFFLLVLFESYLSNFIFMALAPLLSLFYHDYRATAFSGVLYIFSITYLFFNLKDILFPGFEDKEVIYLISFGLYIMIFSMIHTSMTKRLWKRAGQSEERLRTVLDSVDIGIWTFDLSSMKFEVSEGFEQLTGYTAEDFGHDFSLLNELVHPEDKAIYQKSQQEMILGRISSVCEHRIVCRNGEMKWVQNRGTPHFNHLHQMTRLEGVMIDITERKHMEEKIEYLAYHDELTGLPNRTLFSKKFEEYANKGLYSLAVLFIDLNDFKEVNDTYGHDIGDLLLKDIAARLTSIVREKDMVCRLGGDEFLVLLIDINEERVLKVVDRIRETLAEDYEYQGYRLSSGASIGYCVSPNGAGSLEEMIRQADEAMYDVKKRRIRHYKIYSDKITPREV